MNIILEGVDASGKSTLAKELSRLTGQRVIPSSGPEKEPGEIIKRLSVYATYGHAILDRHPAFSHPIYSQFTPWMSDIPQSLIDDVLTGPNLIVYCQPTPEGFGRHVEGEHDSAEHVAMVSKHYDKFLADYNEWGLRRAHMLYRCGEQFDETVARIVNALRV